MRSASKIRSMQSNIRHHWEASDPRTTGTGIIVYVAKAVSTTAVLARPDDAVLLQTV